MAENTSPTEDDCKSDGSANIATSNSATQCHGVITVEGVNPTGVEIGSGTYGRVFEVDYEGTLCAAKELHKHMAHLLDEETFLSYCHTWSTIHHPRVIQLLGVYYSDKEQSILPVMVMEKMQQSLRNLVEMYIKISWNVKLSILNHISLGLRYLHSKNPPIVHCDLTPNNILLGGHLEAKITDIGIAKLLNNSKKISMNAILPFMPPEAQDGSPSYTPAFDVFSFGGVLLYVITQLWPVLTNQTQSNDDVEKWREMPEIMRRNYLLDKVVGDATDFKPLVVSCLDVNPQNRPSIVQISTVIKDTKEKYNVKCSNDEKNPIVWSAKVSREEQSQERQHQSQQQQQFNRSGSAFWTNLNQTWQQCPKMLEKCWVTSATELDGKVYVSALLSTGYKFAPFMYDIDKKQWSSMPTLSRLYFVLVAVHSKRQLLAIGGKHVGILSSRRLSSRVFLWDEQFREWILQYPNMPTPRCSVTGICYRSTVIVAGGITCLEPWTVTRVVEVLHINDSSLSDSHWSTVEQLPSVIYAAIPLLCDDTLYISSYIDFDDHHNNTFTVLTASVLNLLNSSNNNSSGDSVWNKLPDVPYSSHSMICYQGRLITFTGFNLAEEQNSEPTFSENCKLVPVIHIYNPDTMSWDCVGDVSCGYALGRSVRIGENRILFIGGLTGTYIHNHYFSDNWINENLQLELTPVVHKTHPSIIPY